MANEFTLFAGNSTEADELRRFMEESGHSVDVVFCDRHRGGPSVESAFAVIVGIGNIQRFFGSPERLSERTTSGYSA